MAWPLIHICLKELEPAPGAVPASDPHMPVAT